MTALGIIGTLGVGLFLDRLPHYRALNLILFGFNGISLASFCLGTEFRSIVTVCVFCVFFGITVAGNQRALLMAKALFWLDFSMEVKLRIPSLKSLLAGY
jgi:hypothetical protein